MKSSTPISSFDRRSGFATAFFSLLAFSFVVIGIAQFGLALAQYGRERAAFHAWTEDLRMESAANQAVGDLLLASGDGPFVGATGAENEVLAYRLEREDTKLALANVGASIDRIAGLPATALSDMSLNTEEPASTRAQRLADALRARGDVAACALSRVSPIGGGAQASAPVSPVALIKAGRVDWRAGQRWRVSIATTEGRVLDRWVLLTGNAATPAMEMMRARYAVSLAQWQTCGEGDRERP